MLTDEFSYHAQIREHHLDSFGHANHAVYVQLFEEARWEWLTKNGYGLDEVVRTKIGPIVLEIDVKFRKEVRNRERVTITCRCSGTRSRVATIEQTMTNAAGELCATATVTSCLFDTVARRIAVPNEKWKKVLGISES